MNSAMYIKQLYGGKTVFDTPMSKTARAVLDVCITTVFVSSMLKNNVKTIVDQWIKVYNPIVYEEAILQRDYIRLIKALEKTPKNITDIDTILSYITLENLFNGKMDSMFDIDMKAAQMSIKNNIDVVKVYEFFTKNVLLVDMSLTDLYKLIELAKEFGFKTVIGAYKDPGVDKRTVPYVYSVIKSKIAQDAEKSRQQSVISSGSNVKLNHVINVLADANTDKTIKDYTIDPNWHDDIDKDREIREAADNFKRGDYNDDPNY